MDSTLLSMVLQLIEKAWAVNFSRFLSQFHHSTTTELSRTVRTVLETHNQPRERQKKQLQNILLEEQSHGRKEAHEKMFWTWK